MDVYYAEPVRVLSQSGTFVGTECGEGFCPHEPIARATMAVWTVRVLDQTDPVSVTSTRFGDVDPSHPYAAFVERFAELGVTAGCNDGTVFCPDADVTRAPKAAHHPHIPPAATAPPTAARRACPSTTRPTTATSTPPSDTHPNGTAEAGGDHRAGNRCRRPVEPPESLQRSVVRQ